MNKEERTNLYEGNFAPFTRQNDDLLENFTTYEASSAGSSANLTGVRFSDGREREKEGLEIFSEERHTAEESVSATRLKN